MKIGIDIGNTTTLVAALNSNDLPVVIKDSYLVGREKAVTRTEILFKNKNFAYIGQLCQHIKKSNSSSILVKDFYKSFLSNSKFRKNIGDSTWNSEMLIALIVKKIKIDVLKAFGENVSEAVLAIPPKISLSNKEKLKACLKANGINVHSFISFPEAVVYGYNKFDIESSSSLVIDFGPTFLQISIVEIKDNAVKVIKTSDPKIGLGAKIFENLINLISTKLLKSGLNLNLSSPNVKSDVELIAERIVTFFSFSSLNQCFYRLHQIGNDFYHVLITRNEFDKVIEPIIVDFANELKKLLGKELSYFSFDNIFLSGGCSKLINLHQFLKINFPESDTYSKESDKVVAKGAVATFNLVNTFSAENKKAKQRIDVSPKSNNKSKTIIEVNASKSDKRRIDVTLQKKSNRHSTNQDRIQIEKTIINNFS